MNPVLNLVKHKESTRKIVHEGHTFLVLSYLSELQFEEASLVDAYVLDTDKIYDVEQLIREIRTHANTKIALKPLFFNSIYPLPKRLEIHTDGKIETSSSSSYIQRVKTINNRLQALPERLLPYELAVQNRLFGFLYSRNKELEPVATRESLIGYEFPIISLFFKKTEAIKLLENLEKYRDNNFLSFYLKDHVHLCKSCNGNYLNFRECCPKCNAIDIESHDLIHHFVCAHVAPEKDFHKEDGLECPKCDKTLRHIGIDYDKPSSMYSCNTCSHEFQHPEMISLCIDCSNENKLSELIQKSIGSYALTFAGEQTLFQKNKTHRKIEELSDHKGCMSLPLFKILLEQEVKRVKNNKGHSYYVQIQFENHQLQLLHSEAKRALKNEIGAIIKSYLKESDILGSNTFNQYYLILPDTQEHQLKRLETLQYNLSKLLADNVSETQRNIDLEIHKIKGDESLKTFWA